MSDNRFDEEPDGDPHGECAAEIHTLRAQLKAVMHQYELEEKDNDVQRADRLKLYAALHTAEAALADIGDADRNPGDDVAWCEARAAQALPEEK